MTVPQPLPDWLTGARRICVLTGAGISTDSGIPDHRGPQGVWTRDADAEKLVTLSYYLADPEIPSRRPTTDGPTSSCGRRSAKRSRSCSAADGCALGTPVGRAGG